MAEDNRGYWIAEVAELFEDELVRFLLPMQLCLSSMFGMCPALPVSLDILQYRSVQWRIRW